MLDISVKREAHPSQLVHGRLASKPSPRYSAAYQCERPPLMFSLALHTSADDSLEDLAPACEGDLAVERLPLFLPNELVHFGEKLPLDCHRESDLLHTRIRYYKEL